MSEVGAVGKTRRNTMGSGYNFRGIDDMYNALQSAMINHGVFTVPQVVAERSEERRSNNGGNLIYRVLTIKYIFYCEDGSSVETMVVGEAMDSGDKATNKAMSVAHKYALIQVFCIPTEEPKDPENDTYAVRPKESIQNRTDLKPSNLGGTPIIEYDAKKGVPTKKDIDALTPQPLQRNDALAWVRAYFVSQFKRLKESEVTAWKKQNKDLYGFESSTELNEWDAPKLIDLMDKIERIEAGVDLVKDVFKKEEKKVAKQPSFKLGE